MIPATPHEDIPRSNNSRSIPNNATLLWVVVVEVTTATLGTLFRGCNVTGVCPPVKTNTNLAIYVIRQVSVVSRPSVYMRTLFDIWVVLVDVLICLSAIHPWCNSCIFRTTAILGQLRIIGGVSRKVHVWGTTAIHYLSSPSFITQF